MKGDGRDRFQLAPSALRAFAAFEPQTGSVVYRSDLTATELTDSWSGEVEMGDRWWKWGTG